MGNPFAALLGSAGDHGDSGMATDGEPASCVTDGEPASCFTEPIPVQLAESSLHVGTAADPPESAADGAAETAQLRDEAGEPGPAANGGLGGLVHHGVGCIPAAAESLVVEPSFQRDSYVPAPNPRSPKKLTIPGIFVQPASRRANEPFSGGVSAPKQSARMASDAKETADLSQAEGAEAAEAVLEEAAVQEDAPEAAVLTKLVKWRRLNERLKLESATTIAEAAAAAKGASTKEAQAQAETLTAAHTTARAASSGSAPRKAFEAELVARFEAATRAVDQHRRSRDAHASAAPQPSSITSLTSRPIRYDEAMRGLLALDLSEPRLQITREDWSDAPLYWRLIPWLRPRLKRAAARRARDDVLALAKVPMDDSVLHQRLLFACERALLWKRGPGEGSAAKVGSSSSADQGSPTTGEFHSTGGSTATAGGSTASLESTATRPRRYGDHWEAIGFQGNDPATDLRGAGILSLVQPLYLHARWPNLMLDIYALSCTAGHDFPFMVVSINMTSIALQALRGGALTRQVSKGRGVIETVHQFYAAVFFQMYLEWKGRGLSISDFGALKKKLERLSMRRSGFLLRQLQIRLSDEEIMGGPDECEQGSEESAAVTSEKKGKVHRHWRQKLWSSTSWLRRLRPATASKGDGSLSLRPVQQRAQRFVQSLHGCLRRSVVGVRRATRGKRDDWDRHNVLSIVDSTGA